MQSEMKHALNTELDLARIEKADGTPVVTEQESEPTAYDFDYWVVRDRPPYCV